MSSYFEINEDFNYHYNMKTIFVIIMIILFSSPSFAESFEDELGSEVQGLFESEEENETDIFDETISKNEFDDIEGELAFEDGDELNFDEFEDKKVISENIEESNEDIGNVEEQLVSKDEGELDFNEFEDKKVISENIEESNEDIDNVEEQLISKESEVEESDVFDEEKMVSTNDDLKQATQVEEVDELEVFDDEKVFSASKDVSESDVELIERKLASVEYKENKDTVGVLKPSENILNGNEGNKVIVEPRNIIPISSTSTEMDMVPYRSRRTEWGSLWGLSYGLYEPTKYLLDGQPITYDQAETESIGLISLDFSFKYNFSILAVGINTSIGYFQSEIEVETTGYESSLTFIPVKLGLFLELDALFSEPYIVPYGHAGIFVSQYSEKTDFSSIDGTSFLAYYFSAGLMFQLDWIDDDSSRRAYVESGIENTFLFAEVNYLSESLTDLDETAAIDPDLSSLYYSAGLKVEF